jgi:hypothetical protein
MNSMPACPEVRSRGSSSSRRAHDLRRSVDEDAQLRLLAAREIREQPLRDRQVGTPDVLKRSGSERLRRDEIGGLGEAETALGDSEHGQKVVGGEAAGRIERERLVPAHQSQAIRRPRGRTGSGCFRDLSGRAMKRGLRNSPAPPRRPTGTQSSAAPRPYRVR